MRTHTSMAVIIAAAFLLELTTGLMYYTSQNIIQKTMVDLVQREMNTIYLCIRNQLAKVEVTVDNLAWVVKGDLAQPDSMFINAQLRLAIEEAVVNVMNYAYPPETPGDIVVKAMYNRQFVKFVIIDSGRAFDPTEAVKADTTLSAEDRPIGGLGIFLVRELMDSINYERVDGHNILTLRKDLKHET